MKRSGVRPSVCLSRRPIASKQQRRAAGLLQLGRGRQITIDIDIDMRPALTL